MTSLQLPTQAGQGVVVLGMHRSGTSCVGNLLDRIGLYFGDDSISTGASAENPKGFFERRDIRNVCDTILHGSGSDWWTPGDFSVDRVPRPVQEEARSLFLSTLRELQNKSPWFIKEPRLSLVWPILHDVCAPAPVFIHVWRDPIEVALSLNSRNGFPIDMGLALWEIYVRSACAISSSGRSLLLSYNSLVLEPEAGTHSILDWLARSQISNLTSPTKDEIKEAVDAELYRSRDTLHEIADLLTPAQRELFSMLQTGCSDPKIYQSPLSASTRFRLAEWTRREGVLLEVRRQANKAINADQKAQKLSLQLSTLRGDIRNRDQRLSSLMQEFEEASKLAKIDHALARARFGHEKKQGFFRTLVRGVDFNSVQSRVRPTALSCYYALRGRLDAADISLVATSGLFDIKYYLQENPDVVASGQDPLLHFMDFGADELRDPSPLFDIRQYLTNNPKVAEQKINPLVHYLRIGYGKSQARVATTPAISDAPWFQPDPMRPQPKRIVIYTAVTAGYDELAPPPFHADNCDFVVFSDKKVNVEGWQTRPFNFIHWDATRTARFVKMHPHIYFPEYDHSIWVDGNIRILGDIRERFFERLTSDSSVSIFPHPLRNCIYEEGRECIKRAKDASEVIVEQLRHYRHRGYPEKNGLWETNVVVRRHNDPNCVSLMNAWWRELEIRSRRDQISLPVVARELSVKIAPLDRRGVNARDHEQLKLVPHLRRQGDIENQEIAEPKRQNTDISSISIDIGICVHNSFAETRACIDSVLIARRTTDRIILVDDASDLATAELLKEYGAKNERVVVIRHDTNRGYTVSANAVLKASTADWVILLNSDTVVPPKAFVKLISTGEQYEKVGIVGPLSNAASWQTVPQLLGSDGKFLINQIPKPLSVTDMDRFCERVSTRIVPFVPLINGFCYAIRRSVIETIGYFDEGTFPFGYGEEDDFSLRAGAAGFQCAIATDSYVYHVKSASFTSERRFELVKKGQLALKQKHSPARLSAATDFLRKNPELARIRRELASVISQEQASAANAASEAVV